MYVIFNVYFKIINYYLTFYYNIIIKFSQKNAQLTPESNTFRA